MDLLAECERLCKEREDTDVGGWRFSGLSVEPFETDAGDCLFRYTRTRGPLQFGSVSCAQRLADLRSLLASPGNLRRLIPDAEFDDNL